MRKKINIIVLFFITFLMVSGCTAKDQTEEKQNQQNKEWESNEGQKLNWNENFEKINLESLEGGQQILVMGAKNDDGSIAADRIIIGNDTNDFNEIAPVQMRMGDQEELGIGDESGRLLIKRSTDMSDFQNMSEEERKVLREQKMAGGETRFEKSENIQQRNTEQTIVRVTGEIIKIEKDNESITIKLDEGGSRFVLFSDSTTFMKIK